MTGPSIKIGLDRLLGQTDGTANPKNLLNSKGSHDINSQAL